MKPYQEVHGITSITQGTTMRSHQEVHGIASVTQGTTMRSHQEARGITSNSYHSHVSPTNHRFIMYNNSYQYPTNHPIMFHEFIHTNLINLKPNISHRAYMASYLNCLKQKKSSNHVKHTHVQSTLSISLRLKSSHSSERNPSLKLLALAWARLQTEARRGLAQASPSCLGEIVLAQASDFRLGEPSK